MGHTSGFPLYVIDMMRTEVVMYYHAVYLQSGCMFMYCVKCYYNDHVKYNIREHGAYKVVFH